MKYRKIKPIIKISELELKLKFLNNNSFKFQT